MKVRTKRLTLNAKKRKKPAPNPLRIDPTRTAGLRRKFAAELNKRFARLRMLVYRLVVEEDAFGLKPRKGGPALNAQPTVNERWRFLSSAEKLREFRKWLRQQLQATLQGRTEEELWARYIEEGFRKGAGRAFDDTRRVRREADADPAFRAGTRDEFLRSSFAQPVAVEKVKLLASRTFDELEGVTEEMGRRMGRVLTDGLVRGQSPREIARSLVVPVDSYRGRALAISRTEVVRAHSEGQLLALEAMGIEEVGVMVEWVVTDDDKLCELCASMQGVVLKIDEAKGMLPRHVNCRCSWVPAGVGESTDDQTRGKSSIDRAIRSSVGAEVDDPEDSRWAGADTRVSRRRPESILDNSAASDALLSFSRFLTTHSYFSECERDDRGRCLPGDGGGGGGGGEEESGSGLDSSQEEAVDRGYSSLSSESQRIQGAAEEIADDIDEDSDPDEVRDRIDHQIDSDQESWDEQIGTTADDVVEDIKSNYEPDDEAFAEHEAAFRQEVESLRDEQHEELQAVRAVMHQHAERVIAGKDPGKALESIQATLDAAADRYMERMTAAARRLLDATVAIGDEGANA